MNQPFKRTDKQIEQSKILAGNARHAMSYGGSRSGKTFGIVRAIILRACKTQSRHLATRLNFNHAKTSLWHETFPKVFKLCFPNIPYSANKTDYFYKLPNDSEIWVGGLDDDQRVEKILGKEYSTIFFNECSQIPYTSVQMALSRLAERNDLLKRAYYDENPPTKKHWSYPLFIKGVDPDTWEPIKNADNYTSILMNPNDNRENIDDDYLEILENLPEKDRKRFMLGEFNDETSGVIYFAFNREHNCSNNILHNPSYPIYVGMDFNRNPMSAVVGQAYNNNLYIFDEVSIMSSDTHEMAQELRQRYGNNLTVVPDSTGKRLQTSSSGASDHSILESYGFKVKTPGNPFRMDRYNTVNGLLEKKRVLINNKCIKLIGDLEQVSYKEGTTLPDTAIKTLTHMSDALGYLCWFLYPILPIKSEVRMIQR